MGLMATSMMGHQTSKAGGSHRGLIRFSVQLLGPGNVPVETVVRISRFERSTFKRRHKWVVEFGDLKESEAST